MRLLILAVVWGMAAAAALFISWQTRVGPVVYAVSQRHGVHLGDLAAFVVAAAWAGVLTLALVAPRR